MLGVQALGPLLPLRIEAVRCAESAAALVARPPGDAAFGEGPDEGGRSLDGARAAEESAREEEREAWLSLVTVPGVGPVAFASLLRAFGTARAVLLAATDEPAQFASRWREAPADGDESVVVQGLAERIAAHAETAAALAERVRSLGLRLVTLDDDDYPPRLRAVEFPPPLLFVQGRVAALALPQAVAVVGTRRPTESGRRIAAWIASAVSGLGAAVVSGLAVGIDGAAHSAVLAEGGTTVAVLGGGHARLYPRAHERLAEAIAAAGGAVVAELPPDTTPTRGTFPRRNRIISGLASATVVVEAGMRSGALITAGWALEQGRECFVVPGAIDAPASLGCNAFLRLFPGQARIASGIPELLEDLELVGRDAATPETPDAQRSGGGSPRNGTRPPRGDVAAGDGQVGRAATLAVLGELEARIAACLVEESVTVDQLAARTGIPVSTVLSTLTLLELRGLVRAVYGRYRAIGALSTWSGRGDPRLRR